MAALWGFRASRPDAASLDADWARAEEDFRAARFDRAEAALLRILRFRQPTPLDRFLRAQLAMVRDQNDAALADLAAVPDDYVMAGQARLTAGQVELRRNRCRHAEELLRAAVRLDPKLIQAHRELIYIYGMQLRRAKLNGEFLALSQLTKLTVDDVFRWCLLRTSTWEPKEVVETLTQYISADTDDRDSRLALADTYLRMGLPAEAESTVSVLPEDDSEAIAIRAECALVRHDESRAERLLALGRADDPEVARLRGRLALSRRDGPSALKYWRTAFAANPDIHETVFGLLSAMALTGQQDGAAALRDTARNLDRLNGLIQKAAVARARHDPDLMRQLGAACAALHRNAEARAWYALVIEQNPLDSAAQRALFRLGEADRDGRESHPPSPPP
jgi:predicted Zn-dependent protease